MAKLLYHSNERQMASASATFSLEGSPPPEQRGMLGRASPAKKLAVTRVWGRAVGVKSVVGARIKNIK